MKKTGNKGMAPPAGLAALRKAAAAAPLRPAPALADVTEILGISEEELTPKVRAALSQLMAQVDDLHKEVARLRARADHLEQLADQDSLAPVLNRRAFIRALSRNTAFAERYGTGGSVLYFDINGMKTINDSLGHAAGDLALKHVAEVLISSVRASDVVGRLGGDEFGVILLQSEGSAAATKAAQLAEAIAATPLEFDGRRFSIAVAYGVHTLTAGDRVDEALEAADRAMYRHKHRHRS